MDFTSYYDSMTPQQTTTNSVISLIFYVIAVIALWRIFTKAGRPGWLAIIPIVNVIVLIQISGHTGWWILLIWIPILGWIMSIVFAIHLAQSFRRGPVFGFFLVWLLSIIGYLILAFGSDTWHDRRRALA